jgi:hypothetical protein
MINDKQKIDIAKNFNERHAMSVSAWTPDKDYDSDDEHYLTIYDVVQFESPQEQSEKFTFELTSEPSSFAQFIEAHGRSGHW